jgi:hypothetical protein
MRDDSAVVSNQTFVYSVIGPARDRIAFESQTLKLLKSLPYGVLLLSVPPQHRFHLILKI